jgi:hypothetical protein
MPCAPLWRSPVSCEHDCNGVARAHGPPDLCYFDAPCQTWSIGGTHLHSPKCSLGRRLLPFAAELPSTYARRTEQHDPHQCTRGSPAPCLRKPVPGTGPAAPSPHRASRSSLSRHPGGRFGARSRTTMSGTGSAVMMRRHSSASTSFVLASLRALHVGPSWRGRRGGRPGACQRRAAQPARYRAGRPWR